MTHYIQPPLIDGSDPILFRLDPYGRRLVAVSGNVEQGDLFAEQIMAGMEAVDAGPCGQGEGDEDDHPGQDQ